MKSNAAGEAKTKSASRPLSAESPSAAACRQELQLALMKSQEAAVLLYTTLGVSDLSRAVRFYDAVFEALGQTRLSDWTDAWAGWGKDYDDGYGFWICRPFDGKPPTPGNGAMLAFKAETAAQVHAFHAAGLANGGVDEGAPGTRSDYEPEFYVAYLRDPDGNKLAAVFHRYDPAAAVRPGQD